MTPREIVGEALRLGVHLEAQGDRLRILGGDAVPVESFEKLRRDLARNKAGVLHELRLESWRELLAIVEHCGVRFHRHVGGGTWPEFPSEVGGRPWGYEDSAHVVRVFLKASPLPHQRLSELLALQARLDVGRPEVAQEMGGVVDDAMEQAAEEFMCLWCTGQSFWRNLAGEQVCLVCHPPAANVRDFLEQRASGR